MIIENIKRINIIPDPKQPRKYFDQEKLELLKENIQRNGIKDPLKVRKHNDIYIIIDGERRYKAGKDLVEEYPCIIEEPENILEAQLITSCLKEDLTVDELDRAIYKLYKYYKKNNLGTSSQKHIDNKKEPKKFYIEIGDNIGKSYKRVEKAIDRFEYKQRNEEHVNEMNNIYNPEGKKHGQVNSTIAMTDKIKDDEVRKIVIENALEKKQTKKINNNQIKEKVDKILHHTKNIEDQEQKKEITKNILGIIDYDPKKDINLIAEKFLLDLKLISQDIEKMKEENVINHIDENILFEIKEYISFLLLIFNEQEENLLC
jgi:hypothetical protein